MGKTLFIVIGVMVAFRFDCAVTLKSLSRAAGC